MTQKIIPKYFHISNLQILVIHKRVFIEYIYLIPLLTTFIVESKFYEYTYLL